MHDLSAFQRDVLYVLAGNSGAKGLEIKKKLEKYYSEDVLHGRLYPNLNDLADKHYVQIEEADGRTNAYSLTDKGKQSLRARRQWEQQFVDF